jgi:DNA-binding transcriptional MerR regulator
MRIGELAKEIGVNPKTVRYYEDIGVLPTAARTPNGYRTYDRVAADRLRFVREAQATGLTLQEITSILELREQGASTCEHVVGLLRHHLAELEEHIAAMQRTREELAAMIERAAHLDPSDCTDANRCQTIGAHDSAAGVSAELHGAPVPHRH